MFKDLLLIVLVSVAWASVSATYVINNDENFDIFSGTQLNPFHYSSPDLNPTLYQSRISHDDYNEGHQGLPTNLFSDGGFHQQNIHDFPGLVDEEVDLYSSNGHFANLHEAQQRYNVLVPSHDQDYFQEQTLNQEQVEVEPDENENPSSENPAPSDDTPDDTQNGQVSTSKAQKSNGQGSTRKAQRSKGRGSTSKAQRSKGQGSTSKAQGSNGQGSTNKAQRSNGKSSTSKAQRSNGQSSSSKAQRSNGQGSKSKAQRSNGQSSSSKAQRSNGGSKTTQTTTESDNDKPRYINNGFRPVTTKNYIVQQEEDATETVEPPVEDATVTNESPVEVVTVTNESPVEVVTVTEESPVEVATVTDVLEQNNGNQESNSLVPSAGLPTFGNAPFAFIQDQGHRQFLGPSNQLYSVLPLTLNANNVLNLHGNDPRILGNIPNSHGSVLNLHGNVLNLHGPVPNLHGSNGLSFPRNAFGQTISGHLNPRLIELSGDVLSQLNGGVSQGLSNFFKLNLAQSPKTRTTQAVVMEDPGTQTDDSPTVDEQQPVNEAMESTPDTPDDSASDDTNDENAKVPVITSRKTTKNGKRMSKNGGVKAPPTPEPSDDAPGDDDESTDTYDATVDEDESTDTDDATGDEDESTDTDDATGDEEESTDTESTDTESTETESTETESTDTKRTGTRRSKNYRSVKKTKTTRVEQTSVDTKLNDKPRSRSYPPYPIASNTKVEPKPDSATILEQKMENGYDRNMNIYRDIRNRIDTRPPLEQRSYVRYPRLAQPGSPGSRYFNSGHPTSGGISSDYRPSSGAGTGYAEPTDTGVGPANRQFNLSPGYNGYGSPPVYHEARPYQDSTPKHEEPIPGSAHPTGYPSFPSDPYSTRGPERPLHLGSSYPQNLGHASRPGLVDYSSGPEEYSGIGEDYSSRSPQLEPRPYRRPRPIEAPQRSYNDKPAPPDAAEYRGIGEVGSNPLKVDGGRSRPHRQAKSSGKTSPSENSTKTKSAGQNAGQRYLPVTATQRGAKPSAQAGRIKTAARKEPEPVEQQQQEEDSSYQGLLAGAGDPNDPSASSGFGFNNPPASSLGYRPGSSGSYEDLPPMPYDFGFDLEDAEHGSQYRQESMDRNGFLTGRYGYRNGEGIFRQVEYEASKDGFRVNKIRTSEPGTDNQNPADAQIEVVHSR